MVDLQEDRKTRKITVRAHLLARMHKLSQHTNGLVFEDSGGVPCWGLVRLFCFCASL